MSLAPSTYYHRPRWVADPTYIRLLTGFVYLAVILDAWSRRVGGAGP